MDANTKGQLENIRAEVPRYLFRGWSHGTRVSSPSGGYTGLNKESAITPLAFAKGRGRRSVYDWTKEQFTEIAVGHLRGERIYTALSSWAASLLFVLNVIVGPKDAERTPDSVYISIIDTKELWDTNEIFHVPSLNFLQPGSFPYPQEYLAHGVITGPWHKAVPFRAFYDAGYRLRPALPTYFSTDIAAGLRVDIKRIAPDSIKMALQISQSYGNFALPAFLAILCRRKRDPKLFKNGIAEIDMILEAIKDWTVPQQWKNDANVHIHASYGDVQQFHILMQYLVTHAPKKENSKKRARVHFEPEGATYPEPKGKRPAATEETEDVVMSEAAEMSEAEAGAVSEAEATESEMEMSESEAPKKKRKTMTMTTKKTTPSKPRVITRRGSEKASRELKKLKIDMVI